MRVKLPSIKANIEGSEIYLKAFAFKTQGRKVELLPESFLSTSKSGLLNCCTAEINHSCLIRSALIDTEEKIRDLRSVVHTIRKRRGNNFNPLRLVCSQLNTIEGEWPLIASEHQAIAQYRLENSLEGQIVHLVFPTNRLYASRIDPRLVDTNLGNLRKLYKLMNTEALVVYGEWVNEGIMKILTTFKPEALDEYQLEAKLQDFNHQIHSHLMRETLSRIKELAPKTNKLASQYNPEDIKLCTELDALQGEIIQCLVELRKFLQLHIGVLSEIEAAIEIIEEIHPELIQLKYIVLLHRLFLEVQTQLTGPDTMSWGKQILVEQMLNEYLHVTTAVHCDTGIERTSFAFCIRLALLELRHFFSDSVIISLIFNWDNTMRDLNNRIFEKGVASIEKGEILFKAALKLKDCVYSTLKRFCIPFTFLSLGKHEFRSKEGLDMNLQFLNFLPYEIQTVNEENGISYEKFLKLSDGKPEGLTPVALKFLELLRDK